MNKKTFFHLGKKPAQPVPPPQEDEDILPPSRVGNHGVVVSLICGALIFAMIITSLPKKVKESTSVEEKVLSGKAELHTISSVITGAGTLAPGDTETISIPSVVSLDQYYVHNGDSVAAGDILASTDRVEAAYAITQLQPVLNTLDADLNYYASQASGTQIRATMDGKVKAIFGQVGDEVSKVVYEHGALALLSMDGLMMVKLEPVMPVLPGAMVTVTLSDGTEEEGRVESFINGEAIVTLSDERAVYGQTAAVSLDGVTLGEGTLDIHNSSAITGYYGTISQIDVSVDQKIYQNKILFYLTDTGRNATYQTLLERRRELEEQMDALVQLSKDGYLRAKQAGIVEGIPKDADFASLEEIAAVKKLSSAEETITLHFLRNISWEMPKLSLLKGEKEGGDETNPVLPGEMPQGFTVTGMIMNIQGNLITIATQSGSAEDPGSTYTFEYEKASEFEVGQTVTVKFQFVDEKLVAQSVAEASMDGMIPDFDMDSILGSMPSFSFGGMGGGTPAQKSYETYDDSKTDLMTLIPQNEMVVSFPVDELDILQLQQGMDAEIRLDAFHGKVFPGTITRIGAFGENAGGNTKFYVEVTLETAPQMLIGMNASVRVVTDTSPEVSTVPAAALQEEGGKTYLYTSYDAKSDTLGGKVEVTTGMSDGEHVEILQGLPENAAFYYRYAENLVYHFV